MGNLTEFAKAELERIGAFDKDTAYDGMPAECAMELIKTFVSQGHSGGSMEITVMLFERLVRYKPLSPITDDPAEWMNISEYSGPGGTPIWQNRRNPSCFSNDGGKTWYDIDALPITALDLIKAERIRHIEKGYDADHDDEHSVGEIAGAATAYVEYAYRQIVTGIHDPAQPPAQSWRWSHKEWKPKSDPLTNLVIAGAMIVAEIERLKRVYASVAEENAVQARR